MRSKSVTRFVCTGCLTLDLLTLVISCLSSLRRKEGTSHEDLFPAFEETEASQRDLPAPAASQVILISNNQYAPGVACPLGPDNGHAHNKLDEIFEDFVKYKVLIPMPGGISLYLGYLLAQAFP